MKSDFEKVLCDAVRKRIFPHTALTLPVLADGIGCHPETLKNALRQQHSLSSYLVAGLIGFFAKRGDPWFVAELYPEAVEPLVARAKEKDAAYELVRTMKATFQQLEAVA